MIASLVALLVSALCIVWSAGRFRQTRRFARDGAPELLAALRRGGRQHAQRLVAERRDTWDAVSVLTEVLEAPSREYGVAMINEQLSDVRRELDMGADVPRAATRVALAAGTALSVLEIARGLPHELVMAWVIIPFAIGAVAALACAQLGRSAERGAVHHREAWNGLRSRLTELLPPGEPGSVGDDANGG